MEKKLKFNAFLKGVSIFAFVAFCLLVILACVTLPFVSSSSTSYCAFANTDSDLNDCAVACAESNFNYLDYSIPLSQCNTNDTYYGFYFTDVFVNTLQNLALDVDALYTFGMFDFIGLTSNSVSFYASAQTAGSGEINYVSIHDSRFQLYGFSVSESMYSPSIYVSENGFKFSSIGALYPNYDIYTFLKDVIYVFTEFPYGIDIQTNHGFESRFGNFVGLASSDFYINLEVAPVIPSQLCQVLVSGSDTVTDNWYLKGQSTNLDIYYLPLFDKYYINGSLWVGNVNCGWILDYFYGTRVPQLRFRVFNTDIWKADCDFTKNTGLISNVRNGQFLVSSNYISDFNVFKISSADDSLYIMRGIYNDVAYSSFLDSFIAQYDFKNVKIPPDNALYLKGYQSASDEYYNDGYNTGFSDGEKSGYNTGFTAGDSAGYKRGLDDSNSYSFLSLFGAVFDAPIQALFGGTQRLPAGTKITDSSGNTITLQTATTVNRGGLLNFELMGVNLSGFVLALFSLSIIIIVIKFALGKGR